MNNIPNSLAKEKLGALTVVVSAESCHISSLADNTAEYIASVLKVPISQIEIDLFSNGIDDSQASLSIQNISTKEFNRTQAALAGFNSLVQTDKSEYSGTFSIVLETHGSVIETCTAESSSANGNLLLR